MLGTTVGQLTITRQIGEGGMGAVYLAEHRVLRTKHVVKVLLPQWTQNAIIVQRFVNEARAAASISHRNIIRVQDCAQLPDGQWYIVMDYLDGGTLAGFASSQGGPLSAHLILQIIAQVCNGLGAAHEHGIVHRDLKPENIFLTSRDGNPHHVTILDFGIAKLGESDGAPTTRTGQMAGTPAYMAPEQMRDLKSVDPRTDVYALGVITYQLATGGWLPFQDDSAPRSYYELSAAELYHRQLTQAPIDPRKRFAGISDGWANAILAALQPDPARRPPTTRRFAILLAEATSGDGYSPSGVDIVRAFARELLEIGNMLETVRSPGAPVSQPASRYRFGKQLGVGGMAEVFRGTMTGAEGFARDVAIKRVLPGFSNQPQFASMFVDEARIASQLSHVNIVQVLDFDRDAEARLFLVMELVEGKDLDALRDTGPLPPAIVIFIITEVLRGLGYAHNLPMPKQGIRGVVHRDVSPHNVLISWDGAVKVSDFGIAKAREASAATASTMIKGKPGYMSPEQANGEQLDGRSDLFAVGVMLWELLACQPLFPGTTQESIAQVFFKAIPKPSTLRAGVPPDLEAIAMRLLERTLAARYQNAELAIDDLARCMDAPRNGRSDLVRLLVERFPPSTRIDGSSAPSAAAATAPARPPQPTPVPAWTPAPTTLGSAASQAIASEPRRSKLIYGVVGILAVGIAGGVTLGVQRMRSQDAAPATPAPVPPIDAHAALPPSDAATRIHVTIGTTPPGAMIRVDHAERGPSPVTLESERGTRLEISASKDGFVDAITNVVVERDTQQVTLTLDAKPSPPIDATKKPIVKPPPAKPVKKPGFDPNDVGGQD